MVTIGKPTQSITTQTDHYDTTDLKPDNIFANLTHDEQGSRLVSHAVLGDFDLAYRLEDGLALQAPGPVGNAMWRSPEGQFGSGITKSSDIYSFGLIVRCLFAWIQTSSIDGYELVSLCYGPR